MVSTTCMLPSVFTVIRESNEEIRSVWAAAVAHSSKARRQAITRFFMEVRLTISSLLTGRKNKVACGSELAHQSGLVRPDASGNNFRAIVILTPHGTAGHASQHCNLPRVRQSVCNWTLK